MKKIIVIILLSIVTCTILYISINAIMIKSVESVRTDFFNVVCGKKKPDVDYGALLRYDPTDRFEIKTVENLDLEIESAFHCKGKGYMNVIYSFEINDEWGASSVHSKWYIEKQNGRWVVVSIEEDA